MGEVLCDLMDILYPGYWRRQNLHLGNVEYHVGDLVDRLHDKLIQQVARALRHEQFAAGEAEQSVDLEALAQHRAVELLKKLADDPQVDRNAKIALEKIQGKKDE